VVIAIIGILASLLLPALKNARDKASIMACVSNCRQLAIAQFTYADDYNSVPAASQVEGKNDTTDWTKKLVAGEYVGTSVSVFRCPMQTYPKGEPASNFHGPNSMTVNGKTYTGYLSYQINQNHAGTGWSPIRTGPFHRAFGQVYRMGNIASDTIMYTDYNRYVFTTGGRNYFHSGLLGSAVDDNRNIGTSNHASKSATITFFDGSAKVLSWGELEEDRDYDARGISLWNVPNGLNINVRWNSSWLYGYWTPMAGDHNPNP
jgi:type II secretory pathway pseudopilin PulG